MECLPPPEWSTSPSLCDFCEDIIIHQCKSLKYADKAVAYPQNRASAALSTESCALCRYIGEVYGSKPQVPSPVSAHDAGIQSAVCMPPAR